MKMLNLVFNYVHVIFSNLSMQLYAGFLKWNCKWLINFDSYIRFSKPHTPDCSYLISFNLCCNFISFDSSIVMLLNNTLLWIATNICNQYHIHGIWVLDVNLIFNDMEVICKWVAITISFSMNNISEFNYFLLTLKQSRVLF